MLSCNLSIAVLQHAMSNAVAVDQIFYALADPTRRQILETLGTLGARSASSLAINAEISRQAIAKHLSIMEQAGLLVRERRGREICYAVDTHQLAATGRWMQRIAQRFADPPNEVATT